MLVALVSYLVVGLLLTIIVGAFFRGAGLWSEAAPRWQADEALTVRPAQSGEQTSVGAAASQ